jgi:hypothetical protein
MRRGSAALRTSLAATSATPAEPIAPVRLHAIRKLSERSTGRITYQVGLGESGTVYLAVKDNEGGGYFSPEWVSLARVRACLADHLDSGEAFATPLLRGAYRNRSVNNGGFLAAILRHEGLLGPAQRPQLHRCTGDWEAWERDQRRTTAGEPVKPVETEAETEVEVEAGASTMDEDAEDEGPPPGLEGGAKEEGSVAAGVLDAGALVAVDKAAAADAGKTSPRGRRKAKQPPPPEQPDHEDA